VAIQQQYYPTKFSAKSTILALGLILPLLICVSTLKIKTNNNWGIFLRIVFSETFHQEMKSCKDTHKKTTFKVL
jgi:hypothetical protein